MWFYMGKSKIHLSLKNNSRVRTGTKSGYHRAIGKKGEKRVKMENKSVISLGGIRCLPETEELFNTREDQMRIPMPLKFKELRKGPRCKILKAGEGYAE